LDSNNRKILKMRKEITETEELSTLERKKRNE